MHCERGLAMFMAKSLILPDYIFIIAYFLVVSVLVKYFAPALLWSTLLLW